MKISKKFLQGNSNGFVVLKTYFSNHYVQNCGGEKKVNLGHFSIFVQKMHKLVGGSANLHVLQVTYLIFLIS
jgi:hypothetical protein